MRTTSKNWKDYNIPSLKHAIALTYLAYINLFDEPADYISQLQVLAPWKDHNINTSKFPMPKNKATSNYTATRALFYKILHTQQNATKIYTDGSLNSIANTTTCAVYSTFKKNQTRFFFAKSTYWRAFKVKGKMYNLFSAKYTQAMALFTDDKHRRATIYQKEMGGVITHSTIIQKRTV